jgi:hypothetical protein
MAQKVIDQSHTAQTVPSQRVGMLTRSVLTRSDSSNREGRLQRYVTAELAHTTNPLSITRIEKVDLSPGLGVLLLGLISFSATIPLARNVISSWARDGLYPGR